ncbi:MAG: permease [Halanaerobiales bacterium]|nr:permease [Halanaerobiales bacterium]
MTIKTFIKKNKILMLSLLGYSFLFIFKADLGLKALSKSTYYFKEMLQILPAVFVLTAIIQTWVPTRIIAKHFGSSSGLKGKLVSLAIGSLSAGPIYAAFPVCQMLFNKGASIGNIVIILSAWAVVKVPMLINEVKFMGFKYMVIRWIFTIVAIYIMAYIMEKVIQKDDLPLAENRPSNSPMIQPEVCVGCGICVKICPDIFKIDNKKAVIILEIDVDSCQEQIEKAKESCPVMAIS